jgi:hypothetical protein
MTAGLPGVGIGGIFYLASAIMMPARSLVAVVTGRAHEARWRVALQQAAIALGILVALWLTGLALAWIIATVFPHALITSTAGAAPSHVRNVVRTSALLLSLGTLAAVLLFVQVLRVVLPVRPTEQGAGGQSRRTARTAA